MGPGWQTSLCPRPVRRMPTVVEGASYELVARVVRILRDSAALNAKPRENPGTFTTFTGFF